MLPSVMFVLRRRLRLYLFLFLLLLLLQVFLVVANFQVRGARVTDGSVTFTETVLARTQQSTEVGLLLLLHLVLLLLLLLRVLLLLLVLLLLPLVLLLGKGNSSRRTGYRIHV